jgi:RHS repeat-associated protein
MSEILNTTSVLNPLTGTPLIRHEIVFITGDLPDIPTLTAKISPDCEIHLLDPKGDALLEIASLLAGRTDIDALHLFSHGSEGKMSFGTTTITNTNIGEYASILSQIGLSMSPDGDILLYGCNIAAGTDGQILVDSIARLTKADIGASSDNTGSESMGGDWTLEVKVGAVETTAFNLSDYNGLLGADSLLPATLVTPPYSWGGISFQTRVDAELTTSDPLNTMRSGCYWDRYSLTGVTDGTTVYLYMGNSSTVDDYIQIERNGTLLTYNDDGGDGERSYDSFVGWTFQTGDVIRATTYSAGTTGTYSLYVSSGTFTDIGSNNLGVVTFTGTPLQGQTLTAQTPTDLDGIASAVTYRWQYSTNNVSWYDVPDARGQATTLTLAQSESGKYIRVQAFYTDGNKVQEAPVSAAQTVVDLEEPGSVAISGSAVTGYTLHSAIADPDGLVSAVPAYQWQSSSDGTSGWVDVAGANKSTYTLVNGDAGKYFHVVTNYTDDMGHLEQNITSSSSSQVILNVPPVISFPGGGAPQTTHFIEQTPLPVSGDMLVNDSDGDTSWNGGLLKVQITSNAESADTLQLAAVNPGGSGIWLDSAGNKLMAGSTEIGVANASSVTSGTAWTFTFHSNATNALVQDVARSLIFSNNSDNPGTADRAITFTVTDNFAASASAVQGVSVTRVNDAPALEAGSNDTTNEGATFNHQIVLGDPEPDTYHITVNWGDGTANSVFDTTQHVMNISHSFVDNGIHTVTVTADDQQGQANSVETDSFQVTVNNVAPTAPVTGADRVNSGSSYTLKVGAVVDPGTDTRTGYSINWGDGTKNTYTPEEWASAGGSFNHQFTAGSYAETTPSITVNTTDEDGTFVLGSKAITVNRAPGNIYLSSSTIAENTLSGTVIGTLNTTDDEWGTYTYQLLDNANGWFVLAGDKVQVGAGAILDYETATSHTIRVSSTDQWGLSLEKDISISISDMGPDLYVSQIETPAGVVDVDAGSSIEVSWTLATQGTEPSNASWTDRIYLDNPDTPGLDRWVGDYQITTPLPLSPGLTRVQTVQIPSNMQGDFRVVVVTDVNNTVAEGSSGESNNTTTGSVLFHTLNTNLEVKSITAPPSGFAGREIEVQWVVNNTGNASTMARTWYDQIYLSSDTTLDGTDVLLGTVQNASYLDVAEGYSNKAKVTLPTGREGSYHILVKTDGYNHIQEGAGEGDNVTASSVLDVQPIPASEFSDLAVVSVAAPVLALSGQNMLMTYTIDNAGQAPITGNSTVWVERMYISKDSVLDGSDRLLSTISRNLAADKLPQPDSATHFTTTEKVMLPVGVEGDYYFFVTVAPVSPVSNLYTFNDVAYDATPTVVHLTPPPDLSVSAISAPSSAIAGHDLSVTYKVNNIGSSTTPNSGWYDSLYLSSDTALDAGDTKLAEVWHSGVLASDNNYSNTVTVPLAEGLEGSYYLISSTDSRNEVFELNNANNVFASQSSIAIETRPADLIVTEVLSPTSGQAGKSLLVSWTVMNQGAGYSSTGQWVDSVILSSDAVLGNGDDLLLGNYTHTGILNSGLSYSNSALVTLPGNLSGKYQLFVKTDTYNQIYEAAQENNNARLLGVGVDGQPGTGIDTKPEPAADLQVASVTAPLSAASGDWLSVGYTVINSGLGRTNTNFWRDEVILSKDDTIGNADDVNLGSIYHSNRLNPGENYQGTGSFRLSVDLQGDYHVWVRTDANGQVTESLDNNNMGVASGTTTVNLTPTPDLVISDLQAADQGSSGQPLQVSWTVHNNGATTSSGWRQAFYLSRDGVLDRASDIFLGYSVSQPVLAGGADASYSNSFRIPDGISGKYYVFGVVDSNDTVYERGGEGNNTAQDITAVQITQQTPVDLVAGVITVPANGIPGAMASIDYTVTNQSGLTVTGQWRDSLYLSKDAVWDVGDSLFARVDVNELLAGNASYTKTATGPLPGFIGGDYYVIVRSDIMNQIPESNEANNLNVSLDTTRIDVEALALGTPDSASFSLGGAVYYRVDVAAGETLRFNFDRAATEGRTELFVSYASMPSRSDFDYRYNQVDSPDQNIVIANTKAGTYYVMAYNASGGTDNYTMTADTLQFSITDLGTTAGSNKGKVTVRIDGAALTNHTEAILVGTDGVEHAATQVIWKESTELWATFDLRGMATGAYDVKIQDGAHSALLNDRFTVNNGNPGHIEFGMEPPPALRPGQTGTVRIYYQNLGETDVAAPLLTVSGNAYLKLTGDAEYGGKTLQLLGINDNGPAGILSPGASGSFQLFFKPDFAGGGSVKLGVSSLTPDQQIDWNTILDGSKPDNISVAAWESIKANFIAVLGSTTTDYQNNLADGATYLDQLESTTDDIARLFSIDYLKATDSGALLTSSVQGALGYSHPFAWDINATRQSDGNVIVNIAGTQKHFTMQADGSYKLDGQGSATLTETGGVFTFSQQNGTVISFKLDGYFAEIHDSNGHTVQATYESGHLTQVVADNGNSLSFIYNAAGRLIQQTDQAGRFVTFDYDAGNQYLTQVTTAGGITQYGYVTDPGAALHRVSSITHADGTVQHFTYDISGRLIQESLNNSKETVSYSYVGVNEVVATDAVGGITHLWLNENGQIAQAEDALGHVSQLRYDANGNMTGIVNADGTSTSIAYDTTGKPVSLQDALGHTVGFSYDTQFGHIGQVTDQRGNAVNYSYDSQGNLNHITYADKSIESYSYDATGHLSKVVDRSGESVTYKVDNFGHVTQKSYADGSISTFSYDAHGNIITAVDSDSSTTFEYDAADRLIKTTDGDGRWLSYTYDAAGHRTQMADQAGHVTHYGYDALGHLSSLTDAADNLIASYSYDAAGHLSRGDNGNGTYTTYAYDLAGQLTHLVNYKADSTINSRFDYTYDEAGHRTGETTLEGTTNYEYDSIGQLTGVTLSGGRHIAYNYDAAGNRTTVEDSGVTTNYATNNLNEYTGVGSATYSYDAEGHLSSKSDNGITTQYGYDAENHLLSVTNPTDSWSYEYDALGNRIASVHNGARTEYQLDPTGLVNVAAEYDASGNLIAGYTYGLGLESQINTGGNSYYYDYNAVGSTAGLSGSSGSYLNQYTYLPFGENLTTTESVANSFEYVGQWGVMDAGNGLDFMRARYYSEADGRFVQQDPTGVPAGVNLYSYTNNSPIYYSDPSGLIKWGQVASGTLNVIGGAITIAGIATLTTAASPLVIGVGTAALLSAVYQTAVGANQLYSGANDVTVNVSGGLFEDLAGLSGDGTVSNAGKIADGVLALASGRVLNPTQYAKWFEWGIEHSSTKFEKLSYGFDIINNTLNNWSVWSDLFKNDIITKDIVIVVPRDPNDIVGPQSFGDEHWVSSHSALPYTIHYENQATATAPAQEVMITQTLDSDLNVSTFRLGDIGWGDIYVDVPDGVSYYLNRIDLTATKGYMVDVVAGVDVAKHEAYWSLTTIDPDTGEIPSNPNIGFLPPDSDGTIGQGFVNYTVSANADAPTGTVIDAQATIVFTTQEPIDTPAIFSTLDTAAPVSTVEAIGVSEVDSAQFLVRWSGSDVGSAIAGYTVYVSDNGGEYTPWLENTTLTEATYAGLPGHSYTFYTAAIDNAGNREAVPVQADMNIHVKLNASPTDTMPPEIAAVLLPVDGVYATGKALDFAVQFNESVFVDIASLSPVIKLTLGSTEVDALYTAGSGTDTLIFSHVVAGGEFDNDGITLGSAIQANGATLRDTAGNPVADLSFTAGDTSKIVVDNLPTGEVKISGTAIEGQILVASNTLDDVDGLGPISYQWKCGGVNINGATESNYKLTQAEVGKSVTVTAKYIDGHGTKESVVSAATALVVISGVLLNGTASADVLNGGAYGDILYGFAGNDKLNGNDGNDLLDGGAGHDSLNGGAGDDTLFGRAGNDSLQGGAGSDLMQGGADNDFYYVDSPGDVVTEYAIEGTDTVYATVSFLLGDNVENLTLQGTGNINGTGNIGNNSIVGNSGNNILLDLAGGNDVLDGGTGADSMSGGIGNDTYYVDHAGDLVTEQAGEGIDTVNASVSYTLPDNVENLTLQGRGNINGTGNIGNNTITGNSGNNSLVDTAGNDTLSGLIGNDTLTGGDGADLLTGGTGNDIFRYTAESESGTAPGTMDTITDFVKGQDKLDLSGIDADIALAGDQAFLGTILGPLEAFTLAGQLRFDGATGILYGNTDGDAAAEFAIQLTGVLTLDASNFVL